MSEAGSPEQAMRELSRDEMMSALFAQMIIQNTNMALIFMGKVPHPETGERAHDLEAARYFIDQLEMLEVKTRGNLSKEEEKLLGQSLMHARMSFVEAVEQPPQSDSAAPTPASSAPAAEKPAAPTPEQSAPRQEEEPHKRFTKKY